MKTRENLFEEKEDFESYISRINRDWWIFRSLRILGGIVVIAMIIYLLWIPE